jgi:hypothetical protein
MAGATESGNAYKVVEIGDVTDQAVEAALNRWAREGYRFESIHFVTQPGNRRPAMAFLFFTRADTPAGG